MRAFVITIEDNERSVKYAQRCIESGKKHGLEIKQFNAFTPKDNPEKFLKSRGINPNRFKEKYSRPENCMSAFISHYSCWEISRDMNEKVVIFEHDALITGQVPVDVEFDKVMTFSKPSYGKYNTPLKLGVDGLIQKQYFGGAHGYIVKPEGAKELVTKAVSHAGPTDIYLNAQNFPWLQEYYPWVCMAADSFSTIQNETGCLAKHNYKIGYKIIDA